MPASLLNVLLRSKYINDLISSQWPVIINNTQS